MRVLVAYTTMAGSTVEVAEAVAEELRRAGAQVEVRRIDEVGSIDSHDAVIVGAPMAIGWHRAALGFLKRNRQALSGKPVACFLMALSLIDPGSPHAEIPVALDPNLVKPPRRAGHLSIHERFSTVDGYLSPVLKVTARPAGLAIFGGKLDPSRLKWWQRLFVIRVIRARPGDYRNWPFIREWAAGLAARFGPVQE
jgi:menaquinone-dependent protoporphyrinogen oxidase